MSLTQTQLPFPTRKSTRRKFVKDKENNCKTATEINASKNGTLNDNKVMVESCNTNKSYSKQESTQAVLNNISKNQVTPRKSSRHVFSPSKRLTSDRQTSDSSPSKRKACFDKEQAPGTPTSCSKKSMI